MVAYDKNAYSRQYTPWGLEVKKRLLDKKMKADDLVRLLNEAGSDIDKRKFSNLLVGIGATKRETEIAEASRILEIPIQ